MSWRSSNGSAGDQAGQRWVRGRQAKVARAQVGIAGRQMVLFVEGG